jgi:hypothetical protein
LYMTPSIRAAPVIERLVEVGIEWCDDEAYERRSVRERLAFVIMVAILIFLFAFTFAVLGKGEYEPSHEGGSAPLRSSVSV